MTAVFSRRRPWRTAEVVERAPAVPVLVPAELAQVPAVRVRVVAVPVLVPAELAQVPAVRVRVVAVPVLVPAELAQVPAVRAVRVRVVAVLVPVPAAVLAVLVPAAVLDPARAAGWLARFRPRCTRSMPSRAARRRFIPAMRLRKLRRCGRARVSRTRMGAAATTWSRQ
jgi:hypothetical protein